MCDGWASSNVQLTAPLNPAQSSTLRFRGTPDGRGTPLPGGAGSPAALGAPSGTISLEVAWPSAVALALTFLGAGATAPLPAHPEAARRPASRPAGRRRIDVESGASLVGFARGADGGDVGRVGVPVRADDVLAAVARLDVVVEHLPGDLAAGNQRRVPPLLRAVHRADVVEDEAARAVVERDHLGVEPGARDTVDEEVCARRNLVGDGAGDLLGEMRRQVGPLGQFVARRSFLLLLVLALSVAGFCLVARGGQLLLGLSFLFRFVAGGGELFVAVGLLLGQLQQVVFFVGQLFVCLRLLLLELLLGLPFLFRLVARGGELLVAVGLLLGQLQQTALLVGELLVALRLVVRQLGARLSFLLLAGLAGGELLVFVLLLFGELLQVRLGVGELLVLVQLLLDQLLGVPLGTGQLFVLLLLLLLQPVLLRLLQAFAHLGGGQVVNQLLFRWIAARRRLRLGCSGRPRRLGRLEQGLLGLVGRCWRRGRRLRLALLILCAVEGRQHRFGGHRGRDLNGGADVERLGEVLHPLISVLEAGDLEDAVEDVDLGDQLVATEAVLLRQLQRLLELALRLVELAVVVGDRGRLIVRLDLGEDRLLIGGAGRERGGQRQQQRSQNSQGLTRWSFHAACTCIVYAVARRTETGSRKPKNDTLPRTPWPSEMRSGRPLRAVSRQRGGGGRRRSRVSGKSGLCSSGGASCAPGVWPKGVKRAIRRPSASSAFAGTRSWERPPGCATWYVQPAIARPVQLSIRSKTRGACTPMVGCSADGGCQAR